MPGSCHEFDIDIMYLEDYFYYDLPGMIPVNAENYTDYEPEEEEKGHFDFFPLLAHLQEDTIKHCTWQGVDKTICNTHLKTQMTDMGQCWTFNANEQNYLVSDRTGEQNGIDFWINIESYEQFQKYDDDSGIKVHLHPQNEIPQVGDQGFAIPTATHCLASASYTVTHSLPHPFGECQDLPLKTYDKYSRAKCENECLNEYIQTKCQCKPNYFPSLPSYDLPDCNFNQTISCVDKYKSSGISDDYVCPCSDSCDRFMYDVKLSYADINGRMRPDEETYNLSKKVTHAVTLKHRLQLNEFTKTIKLFTDLKSAITNLMDLLREYVVDAHTNPVQKMIEAEGSMLNDILWDAEDALFHVQDHQNTYNAFTHPIIEETEKEIKKATSRLLGLQNDLTTGLRLNQTFVQEIFYKKASLLIHSIGKAVRKLEDLLNWPLYVDQLGYKYQLELNSKLYLEDYDCRFSQLLDHLRQAMDIISRINSSEQQIGQACLQTLNQISHYGCLEKKDT